MFGKIDWNAVFEALKSENIIKYLNSTDPLTLFKDFHVLIPAVFVGALLFFMKFRKTLAFLSGALVLWVACFYWLPKNGELKLHNIATLGSISMGVLGYWIYIFFFRSD